jgi:uncharacterized protein (DUF2141 family)
LRFFSLAVALALAFVPAGAATLATLIVKVEKVSPRGGDVRVALYDATSYPDDNADPVQDAVVPAHPGETIATMTGIKPGIYAVKMFQDFNRNGKFDVNWLGLPIEKYGFSNDARPTFSEPSFDATKFELKPGTNTIVIHMQ